MIHDSGRCGKDDVAKLTRWQKLHYPLLEICYADVVARGDNAGLVQANQSELDCSTYKDDLQKLLLTGR